MASYEMRLNDDSATSANRKPGAAHNLDKECAMALAEVNRATSSPVHSRVFMAAGASSFADAYDTFAINIASAMLGHVYGTNYVYDTTPGNTSLKICTNRKLSMSQELGLKVAAPVGILVGQFLFSWLAGVAGRKRTYGIESMIIIGATFAQTLTGFGGGSHGAIDPITVLAIWRFVMGIGIGKDRTPDAITFPDLTAISVAALVAFVIVVASRGHLLLGDDICNPPSVDSMWRLLIGLGCIPGSIALYFRLTAPEASRFTIDIECNIQRASDGIHDVMTTGEFPQDHDSNAIIQCARASRADFRGYFGQWDNMKVLIGMSYSWFVLGVASHGLGLSSSVILQTANSSLGIHTESESTLAGLYADLINICGRNLILSASSILGHWVSPLFVDSWGRKSIQLIGFSLLAIIFITMGFSFDKLIGHTTAKANTLVFLCCLANFFWDFGPNTTIPIIAGRAFPIRYRSTAYCISAASGTFGVIITQIVLAKLVGNGAPGSKELNDTLEKFLKIFGLITLTGIPSTLLLPETGRKTLEEPTNEGQGGSYQTKLSSEPGVPQSSSA